MKYALVTGGSRGIGRAICIKLAEMGYPVLINYNSNIAAAKETKRIIEENGGKAELIPFDVADGQTADNIITQWQENNPDHHIAILVNNAGHYAE